MRIGIYKDTLANNRGADRAVRNLANALAERGHDAVLFEKPALQACLLEHWDVLISAGTNEILDLAAAGIPLPPVVQQFHTEPAYQFRHWIRKWRRNRAIRSGDPGALPRTRGMAVPQCSRPQRFKACRCNRKLERDLHGKGGALC